jgi:hypothetical protein
MQLRTSTAKFRKPVSGKTSAVASKAMSRDPIVCVAAWSDKVTVAMNMFGDGRALVASQEFRAVVGYFSETKISVAPAGGKEDR